MGSAPKPKTIPAKISRAGLRALRGWAFEGDIPRVKRAVMLAAPHTSNMDGVLLVLLSKSVGMQTHWMVKDEWTRGPIGWATKAVGAVPVDRSQSTGMVDQMVEAFRQREHFHLLVPPEGTRSRAEHWRSGFYRIARAAGVPVIPGYLDYRRKRGGFGEAIELSGDVRADMDEIRAFYAGAAAMARFPEKFGPVRLRDESGKPNAA